VSDEFLSKLREQPRPEYAERLAEQLEAIDEAREAPVRPWTHRLPAFAGAAVVALLALAFTLEPVRAAAREFLDLFRVQRFAAVPVDPQRLAKLQQGGLDLKSLFEGQVQVTRQPQPPAPVDSPEAGAVQAGIALQEPAALPPGYELAEAAVAQPAAFRVRLDADKLQDLANLAGAEEIEIPRGWNGAVIDCDVPPALMLRYRRTTSELASQEPGFVLFQARSPEVELPAGVDIALLARLALRVAGMSASEAETFAASVDWRATLMVPVPLHGRFREVDVNGSKGLLVTVPQPEQGNAQRQRSRSGLVWAAGSKVFALNGPGDGLHVLAMAQSIR
jgi:hypothetical protein